MKTLHFLGAAYCDNYLWFSALEWNGCYRADVTTGASQFVSLFEVEELQTTKLYLETLVVGSVIYFIPWFANHLSSINTKSLELKYWKLPETVIHSIGKFRSATVYSNKIFMFPHFGNEIVIFDIEKETFETDSSWMKEYCKYVTIDINNKFVHGYRSGENIYLPTVSGNFIMCYNLEDKSYQIISFDTEGNGSIDIAAYNEKEIFILMYSGDIWSYNLKTGEKDNIYKCPHPEMAAYRHLLVKDEELLILPSRKNTIKILHMRDGYNEEIIQYPSNFEFVNKRADITSKFMGYSKINDMILLYPCLGNAALKLRGKRVEELTFYEVNLINRKQEVMKKSREKSKNMFESVLDINIYLMEINQKEECGSRKQAMVSIGQSIWNFVKRKE